MGKINWDNVTRDHVIKAIEKFIEDNPEYPSPRNTFLLYEGKKLPAKHIRGMAYEIANHAKISKDDYAGGLETKRFFEKRGFEVQYTGRNKRDVAESVCTEKVEVSDEILSEKREIVNHIPSNDRIRISSKEVVDQKNALQLILNKMFDGDIVSEKTFSWMKTPVKVEDEYKNLYDTLSEYRGNTGFAKPNISLRCDFVCESQKIIIEYDERQHFSEARRLSLEAYRDVPVLFDRELWIKACQDIQAKDNQPYNRDETRAYYDSVRDIEAYKHGYKLVRIMHGQIDFKKNDAVDQLKTLLQDEKRCETNALSDIKIAMYLQTSDCDNYETFSETMEYIKDSDVDILVFPEFCWVPFVSVLEDSDISDNDNLEKIYDECLMLSEQLGVAVIICSCDRYGTIYSVFANAGATGEETQCGIYIKHTMTSYSAFDFDDYQTLAENLFAPVRYKDHLIGMTICYDCNHSLFSRMYGVQNVDIIINSTGGNVKYDKWYKYNQSRGIENHCYCFVTMGGDDDRAKSNSYVYGFSPKGLELKPHLVNGFSEDVNVPGGLYIYDLSDDDGRSEPERSINQNTSINKYRDYYIEVGKSECVLRKAIQLDQKTYVLGHEDKNIVFVVVENDDIFKAEKFLPLMYADKLKAYPDRRYILLVKYEHLDPAYYEECLSVVLKVRAMENFCAVILESDTITKCYQTGSNRTAQVIQSEDGMYGLDLGRMTGPEAIWKNKNGMKAKWRENFAWLARKCACISENKKWN